MRLIDADAMKQHYPIMENDFGMVFNDGLHKELDGEPTVKAIPLKQLEEMYEKFQKKLWSEHEYVRGDEMIEVGFAEQFLEEFLMEFGCWDSEAEQ